MKLKWYHKKTLDDYLSIQFCISTGEYKIVKSYDGFYELSIMEYNETGYGWFEDICKFEKWKDLLIFINELHNKNYGGI